MSHLELRDFYFDEMPVGRFESAPTVPGKYKYEAFRGIGHYLLHQSLDNGESPRCTVGEISFDVIDKPEIGVLELSNFSAHESN